MNTVTVLRQSSPWVVQSAHSSILEKIIKAKKKKEKVKEIQFPTGGMCSFTELLSSRGAAALQQLHSIVNITQGGVAR